MLGLISNHNVWISFCQFSTITTIPPHTAEPTEAPEATVRPANMRFMLHDVATRREGPQSVFISELCGWLHCVNGTTGLTGASCCQGSAEKRHYRERQVLCYSAHHDPGITSITTVGSVTVAVCVCVGVLVVWFIALLL